MNQLSSWLPVPELLILISLLYVIHYHMVILVSQQCWSLAAKCGYRNWLLNLQVTVSHINHGWIRPIYWNTSCATTWILSWILALTLSNFLVLDLDLDNVLKTSLSQFPYVVTLITPWTSPLNSHWKTVPDDILHLYIGWYCHIWSLQSQWTSPLNSHWTVLRFYFYKSTQLTNLHMAKPAHAYNL
jgi:hypothetical protein